MQFLLWYAAAGAVAAVVVMVLAQRSDLPEVRPVMEWLNRAPATVFTLVVLFWLPMVLYAAYTFLMRGSEEENG